MLRDRLRQLWKSETQDSVCKLLYKCFLKTLESVPYPMFPPFFFREMANWRTNTVAADIPLCQRRRRTWQCSGGEGSTLTLSSVIKLHSRWAVWKGLSGDLKLRAAIWVHQTPYLISLPLPFCRHVMNELLETERAYVEELLCVLQV